MQGAQERQERLNTRERESIQALQLKTISELKADLAFTEARLLLYNKHINATVAKHQNKVQSTKRIQAKDIKDLDYLHENYLDNAMNAGEVGHVSNLYRTQKNQRDWLQQHYSKQIRLEASEHKPLLAQSVDIKERLMKHKSKLENMIRKMHERAMLSIKQDRARMARIIRSKTNQADLHNN